MKKFVIAAALAATFLSTGAQAESFADACGHIDNPTRFNPVELSEFQECWIDFHKADEAAGMIGSIFWARAGDGFVSMPVAELREAGSKDAAKAVVLDAIVDTAAIDALEGMLESVKARRDQLIADLATAEGDLAAKIEELSTANATIEALRNSVDSASTSEISVTRDGDSVSVAFADRNAIVTENDATVAQNARNELGLRSVTYNEARGRVIVTLNDGRQWSDRPVVDAVLDAGRRGASLSFMTGTFGFTTGQQYADFISGNSDSYDAASPGHDEMYDARDIRNDFGFTHTYVYAPNIGSGRNGFVSLGVQLSQANIGDLNSALNTAFDQGYDSGYDEGYADGYRDGFHDGVASVN